TAGDCTSRCSAQRDERVEHAEERAQRVRDSISSEREEAPLAEIAAPAAGLGRVDSPSEPQASQGVGGAEQLAAISGSGRPTAGGVTGSGRNAQEEAKRIISVCDARCADLRSQCASPRAQAACYRADACTC